MYQQTSISSEIAGGSFSPATHAYLGRRAQNKYYDYVMAKFQKAGITQAELARRIGKGPDRVNRLLSNPGNWTIETVAVLLAGICSDELLPHSQPFLGRAKPNMRQSDIAAIAPLESLSNPFNSDSSRVRGAANVVTFKSVAT